MNNYLQWKISNMRKAVSNGMMYDVTFSLTGLSAVGKPKATENKVYTCTLVPNSGKWLPHSLSVLCNSEPCKFSYDYVTGVITIPKEYIVGNIEIEAIGADYNTATTAILEVEKITSDTYVSSSASYTGEEFLLLSIYPTKGGTVNVTYGGLTKTITDDGTSESDPASQDVYFGKYKGVSDSVSTPSSGTLTISGSYIGFGCKSFSYSKTSYKFCSCITKIISFGSTSKIPINAFLGCKNLGDIVIPYGVTEIGGNAFGSVESTVGGSPCSCTSINLPNSVTSIGNFAFRGNIDLKYINIPESVTSIGHGSFSGDYTSYVSGSVRSFPVDIDVSEKNMYFCSENGILFNKDKTEILSYASVIRDYTIPNSVQSVKDYAFYYSGITSINIPSSVTSIGQSAFYGCRLTDLYVPSSVTSIGQSAFYTNKNLSNVVIDGQITKVDKSTFGFCGKVFEITLPPTVTDLGNICFERSSSHEGGSITIHITGSQPTVNKIFGDDDHSSGGRNENLDKYNITFTVPDMSSFEQNYDDWFEYGYYYYVKEA